MSGLPAVYHMRTPYADTAYSKRRRMEDDPDDEIAHGVDGILARIIDARRGKPDPSRPEVKIDQKGDLESVWGTGMIPKPPSVGIVRGDRGQPLPQQGGIDHVIRQAVDLFEQAATVPREFAYAGAGPREVHNILPGDVCITEVGGDRMGIGYESSGATIGTEVRGSVNGLDMRKKWKFAGVAVTANRAGSEASDDHSTALVAGVLTLCNTGAVVVPAFSRVAWSPFPTMCGPGREDEKVPYVQVVGHHPDKAPVSVFPYHAGAIYQKIMRVHDALDIVTGKIITDGHGAISSDVKLVQAAWDSLLKVVARRDDTADIAAYSTREIIPIFAYGVWMAATKLVEIIFTGVFDRFHGDVFATVLDIFIQQSRVQHTNMEAKTYDESLGFERPAYVSAYESLNWPIAATGLPTAADTKKLALDKDLVWSNVKSYISREKDRFMCEQNEWEAGRCIGVALATSATGGKLPVLVGYGPR